MDESIMTRRRRILQGAGVGGATLLAGCSALSGSDDDGAGHSPINATDDHVDDEATDDETADDDTGDDGTNGEEIEEEDWPEPGENDRLVAVVTGVDQEEIQQLNMAVQTGEMDEEEFHDEVAKLVDEGVEQVEGIIESETSITVQSILTEEMLGIGAFRVFGEGDELIDLLNEDGVQSLVPVQQWDDFHEQQQQEQPIP